MSHMAHKLLAMCRARCAVSSSGISFGEDISYSWALIKLQQSLTEYCTGVVALRVV